MKKASLIVSTVIFLLIFSSVLVMALPIQDYSADDDGFGYFMDSTGRIWADLAGFAGMTREEQDAIAERKGLITASVAEVFDLYGVDPIAGYGEKYEHNSTFLEVQKIWGNDKKTNRSEQTSEEFYYENNYITLLGRTSGVGQAVTTWLYQVYYEVGGKVIQDYTWREFYASNLIEPATIHNLGMYAYKPEGSPNPTPNPTPEPTTIILLGIGFIGFLAGKGRMKQR